MAILDPTGPIPDEELFWRETLLALEKVFEVPSPVARDEIRRKREWLRSVSLLGKALTYHESPLLTAAALSHRNLEPEHFGQFAEALKNAGSLSTYAP